jgi:pantoate--beta-alanine ligase
VRDLNIPTEIVGCPTLREPNGLAMSSRNAYLSPEERAKAPALHRVLRETARRVKAGEPADSVLQDGRETLAASGFAVDYLELRNADTLAPVVRVAGEALRLLVAARLGRTRLIDNIAVGATL